MKKQILQFTVNGVERELLITPYTLLLELLREDLHLTGTKFGCEQGECGVCTVLVDGEPTLSCIALAATCAGKKVTTVEGLEGREADIIRKAWSEEGAAQCGYCTPSFMVMLHHILMKAKSSKEEIDIREELSGNFCRCTGYVKIIKAAERSLEIARES